MSWVQRPTQHIAKSLHRESFHLHSLLSNHISGSMATLRSASRPLLHVPQTRTVYGSHAFSVAAPTLWNSQSACWHYQARSSWDLSLGLETSWDPFLQVLVSVLVLEPQSWSWSWSWDLGLGLHSWSVKLRPNRKSYVKLQRYNVQSAASIARKSSVRLPPLLRWNGYLATMVCWCEQTGLEWVMGDNCCHSWSTCDATISCKFSCCTVVN